MSLKQNMTSHLHREKTADELQKRTFDLLVVGGGITGAGIALDAASRGLQVALLERRDFASGTSSKSTKLIHGGLRYLKQFEFLLVREVGRERAVVHALAPHLVVPEKMLLPITQRGTFGKFSTAAGLFLYDLLAGVKKEDRRRMLSRRAAIAEEPLLDPKGLLGAGLYAEYRTDDARLTIEVVKTAIRHGAHCLNYCTVEGFYYENGRIAGADCQDTLNGHSFTVRAAQVVNAAGPWVDFLRERDHSKRGKHLFLSKGAHLVVPRERLPLRHSVYFDVEDGRMMFAIPRHRTTYIGTTDTHFEGSPDEVFADTGDVHYLLEATNAVFTGADLTHADVESTWAGLRPLIYEEGKKPGEMSRKDEVFESPSGLLSIAGGKLTGYRLMARKIVDKVVQRLERSGAGPFRRCATHTIALSERPFANAREVWQFEMHLSGKIKMAGLPAWKGPALTELYGRGSEDLVRCAMEAGGGGEALAMAELQHGLEQELVVTALDFMERRSAKMYFDIPSIPPVLDRVLDVLAQAFNWTPQRRAAERASVLQRLGRCCPA